MTTQTSNPGSEGITIRAAVPADIKELLRLMRELAVFERYIDKFAVTESELLRRGFPATGSPEFFALVADSTTDGIVGYAVFYLIPFTADLRPTMVLKELFICQEHRGVHAGTRLLDALLNEARVRGCGRIQWTLLPENDRAKRVYRRWGGGCDADWEHWIRQVDLP